MIFFLEGMHRVWRSYEVRAGSPEEIRSRVAPAGERAHTSPRSISAGRNNYVRACCASEIREDAVAIELRPAAG